MNKEKYKDRVRRPKDLENFMLELTQSKDKERRVFDTLKDCLVFCAALCASEGKENKKSIQETAEPVMLHIFEKGVHDMEFINALAIFDTDDVYVINPDRHNEKIEIFEDYACGGLYLLQKKLTSLNISFEKQVTNILTGTTGTDILDDITNL